MVRFRRWQWLLPLVVMVLCTACRNSSRQAAYPNDPLFVKKAPIEAKASVASAPQTPHLEPTPPKAPLPLHFVSDEQHLSEAQRTVMSSSKSYFP